MLHKTILFVCLLVTGICQAQDTRPAGNTKSAADTVPDYSTLLTQLEQQSAEKTYDHLGTLLTTIAFNTKTNDLTEYPDGLMQGISLARPDKAIKKLDGKNDIVIAQDTVTLLIDYPLTHECQIKINAKNGFTRAALVQAISKAYYQLFDEEDATATVKTVPAAKRTTTYNRNQTNGKYGIWGHDIADLVLVEANVYRTPEGWVILSLNIES
jgi:hypothetical protein